MGKKSRAAKMIDLMEALKASLEQAKKAETERPPSTPEEGAKG